jgi:hypothetical protein
MNSPKAGEFEIFIKLMMMAQSSNDAEALTALRKANAKLASINRNWEELLRGKVAMSDFPDAPPMGGDLRTSGSGVKHVGPEIDAMLDDLMQEVRGGFRDFIESINTWWTEKGFLTDKQYAAVKKAWDNRRR